MLLTSASAGSSRIGELLSGVVYETRAERTFVTMGRTPAETSFDDDLNSLLMKENRESSNSI
jgi:hypothetical protein